MGKRATQYSNTPLLQLRTGFRNQVPNCLGPAEPRTLINVQHSTSNFERPMWPSPRVIGFAISTLDVERSMLEVHFLPSRTLLATAKLKERRRAALLY